MVEIAPLKVAATDLATGTTPHAGHVNGLAVTLAPAAPLVRLSCRAKDSGLLSSALGQNATSRVS